jgi:hypothetical protein
MYAYCSNNPVMGRDPNGYVSWWGVAAGALIATAGIAIAALSYGVGSPIGAAMVFEGGALIAGTGLFTTGCAIEEQAMVLDLSVSDNGGNKSGASLVVDFAGDTMDLYSHAGKSAGTDSGPSVSYAVGLVFNYTKPGDYGGQFVDAGGGINGDIYTNSLEAVELSKERGYRFIELDLFATNDEQKRIVAYHNCEDLNRYSSKNIDCSSMKFDDFINLDSKYTLLYDEKILEYFERYKHLWLVTDKIDDFDLLSEKFKLIKDRMIVEVFSYSKYIEASIKGFQNLAYNIGNKKDFELVEDKNIKQVTISIDFARKQIGEIKKLKDKGVKILGFTAKKTDEIAEIREYIDMFYYDGEENLDELNLNVD